MDAHPCAFAVEMILASPSERITSTESHSDTLFCDRWHFVHISFLGFCRTYEQEDRAVSHAVREGDGVCRLQVDGRWLFAYT